MLKFVIVEVEGDEVADEEELFGEEGELALGEVESGGVVAFGMS